MRTLLGWMALILLCGCGSATVTDDCRQRINDCMRQCTATQLDTVTQTPLGTIDTRSDCERRCHQACYP